MLKSIICGGLLQGAAKSGFVGEASVDFAGYAEATKASSVALPLKNSSIGAILHVSLPSALSVSSFCLLIELRLLRKHSDFQ